MEGINFSREAVYQLPLLRFPTGKDSFTYATFTWDLRLYRSSLIGVDTQTLYYVP